MTIDALTARIPTGLAGDRAAGDAARPATGTAPGFGDALGKLVERGRSRPSAEANAAVGHMLDGRATCTTR